jgi:hypothetical protein
MTNTFTLTHFLAPALDILWNLQVAASVLRITDLGQVVSIIELSLIFTAVEKAISPASAIKAIPIKEYSPSTTLATATITAIATKPIIIGVRR